MPQERYELLDSHCLCWHGITRLDLSWDMSGLSIHFLALYKESHLIEIWLVVLESIMEIKGPILMVCISMHHHSQLLSITWLLSWRLSNFRNFLMETGYLHLIGLSRSLRAVKCSRLFQKLLNKNCVVYAPDSEQQHLHSCGCSANPGCYGPSIGMFAHLLKAKVLLKTKVLLMRRVMAIIPWRHCLKPDWMRYCHKARMFQ